MALGNYSRVDGKKPPSGYSTVTIAVFVALCLVGVWMMTSSSVDPVQNSDVSSIENTNVVNSKAQVGDSNENSRGSSVSTDESSSKDSENKPTQFEDSENKPKQYEDSESEVPAEVAKGVAYTKAQENAVNTVKVNSSEISQEQKKQTEDENSSGGSKSEDNEIDKKEDGESKSENVYSGTGETKEGDAGDGEKKSENVYSGTGETKEVNAGDGEEKMEKAPEETKNERGVEKKDQGSAEVFPSVAQSELLNETTTQNGSFSTQASESKNEKNYQLSGEVSQTSYNWKVCNTSAGTDYIPCLDNIEAIRHLPSTNHYEHRERHCPENPPTCLVPLPEGYQQSIEWPKSREKIWYHNVPHTKLAEYKGHQNWVKVSGEYLTFPGGGTQFTHGALHYIDFIQESVHDIAWGKKSRVVLDVGCGVASFGGFLFDRDVLTMSLAPKDEHEAQTQFALERGIPAISAVMGTKRLPYPGRVFDIVHCARCRVPWHLEGGKLLLELNRLLRPGGFFVWSATPVYRKDKANIEIWEAMKILTKSMCWEVVSITQDKVNEVGIAIYRKPTSNECYEQRPQNDPPLCSESDDPNAAWNVPLQACMHKIPVAATERGSQWPEMWPARVEKPPYWLLSTQKGVYGKAGPEDFAADYKHWKRVVQNSYLTSMGINWSTVRNVMDMRAIYGGFAAALREMNVWVMNIISVDSPDTLPIIYERGLFGMYHDWCESFSTYPRSYDLLHADHLFSKIKSKCNYMAFVAEVDRILRPGGKIILRDKIEIITEMESMYKSMNWEIRMSYSKDKEGLLCAQKSMWRPNDTETVTYALT
ncbi:methyltransferase [Lithospermum erythrorhizon]|uniref:Methyltransferase n=1 Tax=Lithospermum erythrorhizon TaxID=34254 RepID=A0AAV3RXU3_LITER